MHHQATTTKATTTAKSAIEFDIVFIELGKISRFQIVSGEPRNEIRLTDK